MAYCEKHRLDRCNDCAIDFVNLNSLAITLVNNPNLLYPTPGHIVDQKLTQVVTTMKEDANRLFNSESHQAAIEKYTVAASLVASRPAWENSTLMCEQLSTVLANQSSSYFETGDYISALVDAEVVIIRKYFSKGHCRKAKALLGLHRWNDAADAARLGLLFKPENEICFLSFSVNMLIPSLVEIEFVIG